MADIFTEKFIKSEGKKFLEQVLPKEEEISDEIWNDILNTSNIDECLASIQEIEDLTQLSQTEKLLMLSSFKIGLSMGTHFGMITITNMLTKTVEKLGEDSYSNETRKILKDFPESTVLLGLDS